MISHAGLKMCSCVKNHEQREMKGLCTEFTWMLKLIERPFIPFPVWQSAHRRSWWAPQSPDSAGQTEMMATDHKHRSHAHPEVSLPFEGQLFPEIPPSSAPSSGWRWAQQPRWLPWHEPALSPHSLCFKGGERKKNFKWRDASVLRRCEQPKESFTCSVSPQRALWVFDIAAPPAWSASGNPARTSSTRPHSEQFRGGQHKHHVGEKLVFITSTKAPLTFLKPSRTPFMFSYLLKRSAKERSTELRSAIAWSLSAVNCLTDLLPDRLFCCCSSSAERNGARRRELKKERIFLAFQSTS